MHITSIFDAGNIEVLSMASPSEIRLAIRPDAGGNHYQWFHFRVTGAKNIPLRMQIDNAAKASYPAGWQGYRACASYDRLTWFRVETRYEKGRLSIAHTPEYDAVYYAYFAPYSLSRHADRVAAWQCVEGVEHELLGCSILGRDLDLLRIGSPSAGRKIAWIIARQHPGESMAEWLVEGLLDRLLDPDDPVSLELRSEISFFVVPNMNPDGSFLGHLRNNAVGANLNREWSSPTEQRSPEVFYARQRMEQTGVDFFLDVHGDEALPYNFIAGAEGIPAWSSWQAEGQSLYERRLVEVNPDFQRTHGYPQTKPGEANLALATNWVAQRFGGVAMTLEQPFKDTEGRLHPHGWSPQRARRLGGAQLDALYAMLPHFAKRHGASR